MVLLKERLLLKKIFHQNLLLGIFREEKTYPVWMRFNSSGKINDRRGFSSVSLKVIGVEGARLLNPDYVTQDFILTGLDYVRFKNLDDFITAIELKENLKKYYFPSWNPKTWRLNDLMRHIPVQFKPLINLFDEQYNSLLPYSLGER